MSDVSHKEQGTEALGGGGEVSERPERRWFLQDMAHRVGLLVMG